MTASINPDGGRNNRTALVDSVTANNSVEYTWAQNNSLASVTTHDETTPKTVTYAYSADNLLQSRTEGALTDQFVWDTSREIPAMLSDGKYEYVYSQDRTPLAQIKISTGVVTYLHKDLTGSVTASTNATGGLVGTVDYSPYGVPTGSLLSRFGYAGEWVDAVTGYSYLKARWLDTKTGTFLSEDPLVQMTNNAFGYTDGNPITQIDPLGLVSSNLIITNPNIVINNPLESIQALKWTVENSGTISGLLGLLALGLTLSGVGAPLALVAGYTSMVFGTIGTSYEGAKCILAIPGKPCDPVQLGMGITGLATGGLSNGLSAFAKSGSTLAGLGTATNFTSTGVGVISMLFSAAGVSFAVEKNEEEKGTQCK